MGKRNKDKFLSQNNSFCNNMNNSIYYSNNNNNNKISNNSKIIKIKIINNHNNSMKGISSNKIFLLMKIKIILNKLNLYRNNFKYNRM